MQPADKCGKKLRESALVRWGARRQQIVVAGNFQTPSQLWNDESILTPYIDCYLIQDPGKANRPILPPLTIMSTIGTHSLTCIRPCACLTHPLKKARAEVITQDS